MGTLFPQPTPFRSDPRIEGPRRDRDRHPQHPAGLARLAAHRVLPPRHAGRIRVHVGYLHQPARGSHQGLYHLPLLLIDEPAAMTEHTVNAFDEDIVEFRWLIAEIVGLADQPISPPFPALAHPFLSSSLPFLSVSTPLSALSSHFLFLSLSLLSFS